MSDFGEPWKFKLQGRDASLYCEDGHLAGAQSSEKFDRRMKRAAVCVNALEGIADPAEFVERAKAAEVLARRGAKVDPHGQAAAILGALAFMNGEGIAALAKEWTPDA